MILGQFILATAGVAADPRIRRANDHVQAYLDTYLRPFTSGKYRIYKGRLKITDLRKNISWTDDVNGVASGSITALWTTPPNPAQKVRFMEIDLYRQVWNDPDEKVLFRFRPFGWSYGHVEIGDAIAFQEFEIIEDNRPDFPQLLVKRMVTRAPILTEATGNENYSVDGSIWVLDPAQVTFKDVMSTVKQSVSTDRPNDLIDQQANGNLFVFADKGNLKYNSSTELPYEEALQVDATLPACEGGGPYSFNYEGTALIPSNIVGATISTKNFTNLKCLEWRN